MSFFHQLQGDFPALLSKIEEMGFSLKNNIVMHYDDIFFHKINNDIDRAQFCLSRAFSSNVHNHVDYLINYDSALYLKIIIDKKYTHMVRTRGSITDFIKHIVNTYFRGESANELTIEDTTDVINISGKDKTIVVKPLYNSDFVDISEQKARKMRNAFKGVHSVTSVEKLMKKFKSIPLLASGAKRLNDFYGIKEGDSITIPGSSPYMDNISNYVAVFKEILNDHLLNEKVSLSQSQELFVAYFNAGTWHLLAKNEKKFSITPFHVSIGGYYGAKETFLFSNFESAMVFVSEKLKGSEEELHFSATTGTETKIAFGVGDKDISIIVSPINDHTYNLTSESQDERYFPRFLSTLNLKKSFEKWKPSQHELPVIFEKHISGQRWCLIMDRFRGVSYAVDSCGYHTAEIGNASILKSEKGNYSLCRYNQEVRHKLGYLSDAAVISIHESFGVPLGYGHQNEFRKSEAYQYYKIWANDHLEKWIKDHAMEDAAVRQPRSLLKNK